MRSIARALILAALATGFSACMTDKDVPDEAVVETNSSLEADPDRAMAPEEGSAAAGIGAGPAYAVDSGATVGADGTTVASPSVTIQDSGNANATVIGVPFCSNINVTADCWTWVNTNS